MDKSNVTRTDTGAAEVPETGAASVALDKTPPDDGAADLLGTDTRADLDALEWQDDDVIYPEGYDPDSGADFIPAGDDPLGVLAKQPDALEVSVQDGQRNPAGSPEVSAPDGQSEKEAAETPEAAPEPDYKALYEASENARKADQAKELYRKTYHEQIAKLADPDVAALIAKDKAGGVYPLEDAPEETGPENKSDAALPDFADDMRRLSELYPDADGIPMEVMREYRAGTPLLTAYAAHKAKSDAQTIAALRAENAALKQNAANRERAVVRGVNGGSPVNEPDDPFLRGLREDW